MNDTKRFTCDGTYPRGYHYVVSDLTYAQVDQMLETLGRNSDADILFKQLTATAGGDEWDERQMFAGLKQAWINKGYVKRVRHLQPRRQVPPDRHLEGVSA